MDVTELHDEENLLVQMQDRWENYGSLATCTNGERAIRRRLSSCLTLRKTVALS